MLPGIALLASLLGCGSRDGGASTAKWDRIAILPFENLTGDPAVEKSNLPAQAMLQSMLQSRVPGNSEGAAVLNGATAVARGVIERTGKGALRLNLDVYSTSGHKLLHSHQAEGGDVFEAATRLAKAISPEAVALTYRSPKTLELWSAVLNGGTPEQLKTSCKSLIEGDPSFSPAYGSCVNVILGAFSKEEAAAAGELAYQNRDKLTIEAQNVAGQILFQASNFAHANELLRRAAPTFPASWNQVGYAEALLGHADESMKALEQYRKLGGDESNAVDSMGETQFILSRFAEAEKHFLECAERFPQSTPGRTGKLKAAAMRALRGDRAGAEQLAMSFIDPLRKAGQDTRKIEEAWREVILEQDPKVMRTRIERSIIGVPGRNDAPSTDAAPAPGQPKP